jgi:PleD family two-component response regulator
VAERARGAVEALQIQFVDSAETDFPYLTISVGGVSRIPLPGDRDTSLIDEADQMLYQVKSSGKNRVLIA